MYKLIKKLLIKYFLYLILTNHAVGDTAQANVGLLPAFMRTSTSRINASSRGKGTACDPFDVYLVQPFCLSHFYNRNVFLNIKWYFVINVQVNYIYNLYNVLHK